jgi:hypothetical protein
MSFQDQDLIGYSFESKNNKRQAALEEVQVQTSEEMVDMSSMVNIAQATQLRHGKLAKIQVLERIKRKV